MTTAHLIFLAALALPTILVIARAVELPQERLAWSLLSAGLCLWTAGFAFEALNGQAAYVPGLADVIWVAAYPFPLLAMLAFARPWLRRAPTTLVLETSLVLFGTAAVVTALVLPPVIANASDLGRAAQAVNFAYPMFDGVLLSTAIIGAAVAWRRPESPWPLIAGGAAALVLADTLWALRAADGTWKPLMASNLIYPLWPAFLAAAAWLPKRGPALHGFSHGGVQTNAATLAAAGASILLLILNEWLPVPAASVVLAALALLIALHRSGLALAASMKANLVAAHDRELVDAVEAALANNDLSLHYQPLVDASTGTVRGAEALIRWYRDGAFVPPDSFLPSVEHSKLMRPLTDFVLDRALETAARWWADGYTIGISVNLATANLSEGDLPGRVLHALCRHRLPPWALTLEITETAEIDDNVMAEHVLLALHQLGVGLSVDDFGTGHSSLVRLARFPISELKIDRSFVKEMHTSKQPIVATAIQLAQTLGLSVVAEGVEDDTTLDALRELGCDLAQGYFVSRPLPSQDFEGWLFENASPQLVSAPATTVSSSTA